MIDANQWLEQNYPQDDVCKINESFYFNEIIVNNLGRKRSEITHLAINQKELTGTLDLSSFLNLIGLACWGNQLTNLILPNNDKLIALYCSNNKLSNLDLSNCVNLRELHFFNNQLTNLILPTTNRLEGINASNNYLTTFNYHCLNPATLKKLYLFNNNLTVTNLHVFSQLDNLTHLIIGNSDDWMKTNPGNQFTGSLESLRNLTKLEYLDIQSLNLPNEFQYLSSSLQRIECAEQMREELNLYGNNLQLWQAYHPHLMQVAKKEIIKLRDFNFQLKKQIRTPFLNIFKSAGKTNYDQQFQYNSFFLRDPHPFSWENKCSPETNISGEWETFENNITFGKSNSKNKNLLKNDSTVNLSGKSQNQLPLRLYNLITKEVINSKELSHLNNYLTLSYCWGTDWENTSQSYGQNYPTKLTKLGRKALNKVHATYQFLKKESINFPNYIWIDNFCINQSDQTEKEQEVSKQRNYYSNATATLIAIDAKIDKLKNISDEFKLTKWIIREIINSLWFHRSWTFQEGLLSRQTIFMFDDCLIDGRKLALYWGGRLGTYNQPSTFITPLGWSYHNEITQIDCNYANLLDQTSNLTLGEALHATFHREQTILLDSIYSILGLLPYGDQINIEYQNECTIKDLEIKLAELINQAYLYNPKEIITYLGKRNHTNWWLPIINENNSFNISNSLNYDERYHQYFLSQIQNITKQGIQLKGHYTLLNDETKIIELDRYDQRDNTVWPATLQFTLNKNKQLITIKEVREWYYPTSQERNPQELFIDMLNYEVISELAQPEKYKSLVYQPIINYGKDQSELSQAEIKHFLTLTSLDLANLNLTETLDLSELINLADLRCNNNQITELILPISEKLKIVYCYENQLTEMNVNNCLNLSVLAISNNQLTNLDLTNNHKLTWLNCKNNQLRFLNVDNCLELKVLVCSNNQLVSLNLNNDSELVELYCSFNKLTELILPLNNQLKIINVNDCLLKAFNCAVLNPHALTWLSISDNNLPTTDIAVFSHLINLEYLWIGNWNENNGGIDSYSERIKNDIYNRFFGSLASWKNLTKLKSIYISNTDINTGVEFLSPSITEIYYSTKERPDCQLKLIEQEITKWLERKQLTNQSDLHKSDMLKTEIT